MSVINSSFLDLKTVREVIRNYSPLLYSPKLRSLLTAIYPNEEFAAIDKFGLHKRVNHILVEQYPGEQLLKYVLFDETRRRKLVGAYEIKVNRSRVDFLTINGVTTSYEIKSSLDNLSKLSKQCADYLLAFEYNNLVTHQKHLQAALKIVPKSFGILIFDGNKKTVYRKAELNESIDPGTQLSLLTKKELLVFFDGHNTVEAVLANYSNERINNLFKKALKERYMIRWQFIVRNFFKILPIDLQFFFNTNIEPQYIYNN